MQGKFPEAETLCQRVLAARKRTQGNDHPDTLYGINKLAQLKEAEGDDAAAEALFLRAQTGLKSAKPPGHYYRLDLAYNFSLLRQKQGRLAEASVLAESSGGRCRKRPCP